MRIFRALPALALLSTLTGCGYVHFGRVAPAATATGDAGTSAAYTNLSTEHKILKQELAIARKEGEALRAALERGPGAASPELANQLNETTRELATLRANYAKLQVERAGSAAPGDTARTSELEERLAASLRNYTQLQEENAKLRTDIDRARMENSTLTTQLKTATSENEQAQTALAQLNTELLAQKDARARAEQATAAVRVQLGAVMARREPVESATRESVTPPAGNGTSSAAAALALAKAPPADSSVSAELRTSLDRARTEAPAAKTGRTHVVAASDTLEKLAEKYYGEPKLWVRIYSANLDLLRDGRPLKAGMELEIPGK